jgi:beta-phosphoglucomutase-like phosphatase (HAD superfamily)
MIGIRKRFAVIFDMDGLMLDTERVAMQAWKAAAAASQLDLPDDVYCSIIGLGDAECQAVLRGLRWSSVEIERVEAVASRQSSFADGDL